MQVLKNYIEVFIGVVLGILFFLTYQGFNTLPAILFFAVIGSVVYFNFNSYAKKNYNIKNKENLISFDDIGGQDTAKNELIEALDFIKDSEKIKLFGIRPIKGILFNGPPGTGKTMLAKAAANYTDSAFLSASGSEFVEMYVGVGAKRIRKLFLDAKVSAKKLNKKSAVIFIDEIDVLAGKRGQNNSHQEHEQTLNELLVQMDGLNTEDDIKLLLIGATNRIDILDGALLRPGRFDRIVKVDLPDKKARINILKLHTKDKPLDAEVSIEVIANDTFGFSGAHLESVTNEAAVFAMRENSKKIYMCHFNEAIEKVIMGEKLDRIPHIDEKKRIAVHECGHAIICEIKFPESVVSINISSRSNALGYVRQSQENDIYLYTYDYLSSKISVALAGALAEELILGSKSTGAFSDYSHAAKLSKDIIFGGMSSLGIVSKEDIPQNELHSGIQNILKEIESQTKKLLLRNIDLLTKVSELLLQKEYLSGQEFRTILGNQRDTECA